MTRPRPSHVTTDRTRTGGSATPVRPGEPPTRGGETDRPSGGNAWTADSDGYFGTGVVPATIPPTVYGLPPQVSRPQEAEDVG